MRVKKWVTRREIFGEEGVKVRINHKHKHPKELLYKILQLDLVVGIILDLGAKNLILILSDQSEHDNLNFDYLCLHSQLALLEP